MNAVSGPFSSVGFMPHGHYLLWSPALLCTYVLADGVIALSYFAIPLALWYFARKRPDLPFRWLFHMFAVFVLASGTTHVVAIWNIWHSAYWLDATLRVITALASIATAALMMSIIPKALALKGAGELAQANLDLAAEVAERREVEERLRERTVALESQNRELESFAHSASHDLRAPLRSIEGLVSLVQRSAATRLEPEDVKLLEQVRRASLRMSGLVHDLMRLSRVSRHELSVQSVDLGEMVAKLAEPHRAEQPERVVEIVIEPGARAIVDRSLVAIMLDNLLSNALKFTRQNTSTRIEFGHRKVGEESVFHLRDNGVGFDMARADKLFRPFGRLHPQEEFEGTGVGLTIVLRIVERHGGRVWAESTDGQGAVFYFTLAPVPGVQPGSPDAGAAPLRAA